MAIGRRWGIVGIVATSILLVSIVPLPESGASGGPTWAALLDEFAHALGYAILAASLVNAFKGTRQQYGPLAPIAVVTAFAFGFGIELLQTAVPTRGFAVGDILANGFGSTVGAFAWFAARGS